MGQYSEDPEILVKIKGCSMFSLDDFTSFLGEQQRNILFGLIAIGCSLVVLLASPLFAMSYVMAIMSILWFFLMVETKVFSHYNDQAVVMWLAVIFLTIHLTKGVRFLRLAIIGAGLLAFVPIFVAFLPLLLSVSSTVPALSGPIFAFFASMVGAVLYQLTFMWLFELVMRRVAMEVAAQLVGDKSLMIQDEDQLLESLAWFQYQLTTKLEKVGRWPYRHYHPKVVVYGYIEAIMRKQFTAILS